MFFNNSKLVAYSAFALSLLTLVLFAINRSLEDTDAISFVFVIVGFVSLLSSLGMFARWMLLTDRRNEAAFKEAFGVMPHEYGRHGNMLEEYLGIQELVNCVLRQKAQAFDEARTAQQRHFSGVNCKNPNDAARSLELQSIVRAAKAAFWQASDIASHYRFEVKGKYSEWLEAEPAAERQQEESQR